MHFDVNKRTILMVRHGSHAYGLNTPTSDEDFKGVCIKPKEAYLGFLHRFEQHEHMGSKTDGIDSVVYSLDKFAALAADCNPNIIEVLHVADEDVIDIDDFGELLREHRNDFLSKKAKFTFAGYAHAQLKRIKTHRGWLLNKPTLPTREEFGLSDQNRINNTELGAFDSLLDLPTIDDAAQKVESRVEEIVETARASLNVDLPKNVVTLFVREKAYRAAVAHHGQFLQWEKSRNPARAELEAKFGYDTKHGMHLLRLMRMCKEILTTGKVNVKRADREELLAVRLGQRSYDSLVEEAMNLETECDELYKTSTLPREPDRNRLDVLVVGMTQRYLTLHG